MALRKNPKADLRKSYPLYVQIGLLMTLGLLILAFRADFEGEEVADFAVEEQEVVSIPFPQKRSA